MHLLVKAASRYVYSTIRNSSMGISNIIGPMEKIEIGDYPVKNFYFIVVGMPQVTFFLDLFNLFVYIHFRPN